MTIFLVLLMKVLQIRVKGRKRKFLQMETRATGASLYTQAAADGNVSTTKQFWRWAFQEAISLFTCNSSIIPKNNPLPQQLSQLGGDSETNNVKPSAICHSTVSSLDRSRAESCSRLVRGGLNERCSAVPTLRRAVRRRFYLVDIDGSDAGCLSLQLLKHHERTDEASALAPKSNLTH